MVATQVLISVCVAIGLTAAAPQLDLPGQQRTVITTTNSVDEEALVTDVVTALEPSIAAAVANALRSLQTSSVTTTTLTDSAQIGGGAATAAAGFSSSASKSSSSLSAAAEKAAFEKEFAASRQDAEPTTRPEYNFEFKVADADEQTYITQQETRDGDDLTGSYSYVDPTGALITVNYQAGPMGFTQTTDKQEGFVQIVAKPPRLAPASGAASAAASGSKFTSSVSGGASSGFTSGSSSGAAFSSQASNSASLDQSALIAQILAALQPQISASVNAALTASQSRSQESIISVPAAAVVPAAPLRVAARPAPAARPAAAGGNLASVFGDGYAVRIATPEFKIEY